MNREQLFELHTILTNNALSLMKLKNQDYGGDTDPFNNFHRHGEFGILVRMSDKLARLESFCQKGFNAVSSEGVTDTVMDMINYSVLLTGLLIQTEKIQNPTPDTLEDPQWIVGAIERGGVV
jgi:hypothetical protein